MKERKIKTNIEWEFHTEDLENMPEITIDLFQSLKPKINKNIEIIKLKKTRNHDVSGNFTKLF